LPLFKRSVLKGCFCAWVGLCPEAKAPPQHKREISIAAHLKRRQLSFEFKITVLTF
jgi:hypothetical protein